MEEYLHGKEFNDESLVHKKSNKQFKTKDLELEHVIKEIENIETEYKSFTANIWKEEQNALKDLMNNPDIIFEPTDKGGGLVLMDQPYYQESLVIKRRLDSNVYQKVPLNSDKKVFQKLKLLVEKYRSNLTIREVDYLINF